MHQTGVGVTASWAQARARAHPAACFLRDAAAARLRCRRGGLRILLKHITEVPATLQFAANGRLRAEICWLAWAHVGDRLAAHPAAACFLRDAAAARLRCRRGGLRIRLKHITEVPATLQFAANGRLRAEICWLA